MSLRPPTRVHTLSPRLTSSASHHDEVKNGAVQMYQGGGGVKCVCSVYRIPKEYTGCRVVRGGCRSMAPGLLADLVPGTPLGTLVLDELVVVQLKEVRWLL